MSPGARWIAAVVGLLAACVVAMVVLIVTSSTHPPQVLPSYEQPSK
jgi:hypothetical protein